MENIKVLAWLKNSGSGNGCGNGCGDGSGSEYGNGCGDGCGDGSGFGYGNGSGYGSGGGCGDGSGSGSGFGYGYGNGSGFGYEYGNGSGFGSEITSFNGNNVYIVDSIQTIITHIKDSVAKGFILHDDFTLTPCFVVKGNGYFAHGKTLEEAMEALQEKFFENIDTEEAIEMFMDKFKKNEKYPGTEFFEWHHHLTGSCLMGRESFVRNHGLDVNAMYTVDEFISICENDYGSEVIKELKEKWREEA